MEIREIKTQIARVAVPKEGQSLEFKEYIAAFFDLLGQRDKLRGIKALPSSKKELLDFEKKANATLGAVCEFRRLFNEYFSTYISVAPPPFINSLPPDEKNKVLKASEIDIKFQGFSDTLIVYFSAINRHGKYQWRGIHALLAACATLVPTLLSVGIPLRAGIEFGIGCEFVPGELYGPVLQKAYYLESRVANYPRIVIGPSLADLLNIDNKSKNEVGIDGSIYDKHTSWIGIDSDGNMIVDYLGRSAQQMTGGFLQSIIKDAYNFVCIEHKKFCKQPNSKILGKYKLLKSYFKSRL